MIDNVVLFYVITALVMLLVGLSKGGLGGVLGALATPLMVLVLPPDESAIGLVLPLLMLADIFAVALHWRKWNIRLVLLLLPGAIIGVTIGTWLITNTPTRTLRIGLGVIVLLFVVYKLFENRLMQKLEYISRNWHGLLAGAVTGFSSSLAHIGGPPVSIYLVMQNLSPRVFVATSAFFFFILNWIKVPYYIYAQQFDLQRLLQIIWLAPCLPLGVGLGRWMVDRIDKDTFEQIIVFLLGATGLLLIFAK